MAQHTPGPWSVEADERLYERHSGENGHPGSYVAGYNVVSPQGEVVGSEGILGDGEANAHLIAAAPELLEVLKLYLVLGAGKCTIGRPQADMALAAVRKAEGL
jgi:hypothetical protein